MSEGEQGKHGIKSKRLYSLSHPNYCACAAQVHTHTHTQTTLIDVYCDRTPRIPVHVRTLPTSHCDTYSAQSRSVCVDGKRESRVQCVCESDHP